MKLSKLLTFIVVLLLITSCLPTKLKSLPSSTASPYAVAPSAPSPIPWPQLGEGWMYFNSDIDNGVLPVYDPSGYFWSTGNGGLLRWDIETGEVSTIKYGDDLPFAGTVRIFAGKTWLINTFSGETAYYFHGKWIKSVSIPFKHGEESDTAFLYSPMMSDTGDRLWVIGGYTDYSKCPTTPGSIEPSCISRYAGIYYFDGQAWNVFPRMPDQYDDYTYFVAKTRNGSFWFTNGSYVIEYDGNAWQEHENLRGARVITSADGELFFVFEAMIISFDGEALTPLVFPGNKFHYPIEKSYLSLEGDLLVKLRNYYNDPELQENSTYLIRNGQIEETPDLKFENPPDDAIDLNYQVATPRGWIIRFPNGFYLYDGDHWKKYEKPNSSAIYQAMDGAALGFTQDGSLWVKDRKGIKRFDGSKNEYVLEGDLCPTTPQPDPYHAIEYHMDVKGNIWAGSAQDDRLCYFDVETLEVSIFELDYDLNRFSLSPDGSVWAASEKGYIANFTLDSLNKEAYDQIPMIKIGGDAVRYPLHPLRIEVSSDGAVWVFAEYSGLYRYDGKAWKYYGLPNLEDPSAFAIDTKGHVWAGVTNVVLKHDGIKWTEYPIPTEFNRSVFPSHMVVAPDGIIWFANNSSMLSSKSAYRFDGANWTHFAEVFPDTSFIEKIIFAPDGAVWLINYYHWARYKQ